MREPKIVDADFTVVRGPGAPKPKRRKWRIYLAKDWWIVALLSGAAAWASSFPPH